jgi:predicted esterase
VLAGFSHGGAIALEAALRADQRLGGVVALSPWFLAGIPRAYPPWLQAGRVPALFCHGAADRVVQPGFARYVAEGPDLAALGIAAEVNHIPGLAHGVSAAALMAARQFLLRSAPRAPAPPRPPRRRSVCSQRGQDV